MGGEDVSRDGTNGALDAAEEFLGILRANGKRFMTLNAVRDKMSSQLRGQLGMRGRKLTAPSLKKIFEPHLDETLEIRQNGRYTYLVAAGDLRGLIVDFIRKNPGKQAGGLASSLPFKKAEFLNLLNELMKDGRLYASLKDDYKARFFVSETSAGAEAMSASAGPGLNGDSMDRRREEFLSAFRELDGGRVFIRIPDLRRRLMWPREVFDGVLRALRDDEVVQLHSGDVTAMTPGEVEDCFVDEFGSRKGTVTLKK